MNRRPVLRVLGVVISAVGAAMLPAAGIAAWDRSADLGPLLLSSALTIAVGVGLMLGTRGSSDLRIKDGFAVVTFGWMGAGIFGALPFLLSGSCDGFVDAIFESVSGFTTTGATIFTDIEVLPRGILFWRSMTHWLGGMGIVVLSVAVLPFLGVGGMQLFKAEVPGPTADKLTPRIQSTATILWGVYFGLTAIQTGLLMLGGMDWFESVCHSFGTVATGGFSTRNSSIGAYDSPYIQWVITLFMFLAGVNFALHFGLIQRQWKRFLRDEELRFYGVVTVIAIVLLWGHLFVRLGESPLDALRLSAFQSVSIITTTGYGTADFLLWGFGAQVLLFGLMFAGGCAGSTGGSMKQMRVLLLFKHGVRELRRQLHPHGVFNIKLSRKPVGDDVMMNVLGFFLFYIIIFAGSALLLAVMGVDTLTALGASAATLGNVGPGLGSVGPTSTYADIPQAGKLMLSLCMLLGRLELFTVLVIFTPMFWRRT